MSEDAVGFCFCLDPSDGGLTLRMMDSERVVSSEQDGNGLRGSNPELFPLGRCAPRSQGLLARALSFRLCSAGNQLEAD